MHSCRGFVQAEWVQVSSELWRTVSLTIANRLYWRVFVDGVLLIRINHSSSSLLIVDHLIVLLNCDLIAFGSVVYICFDHLIANWPSVLLNNLNFLSNLSGWWTGTMLLLVL